ncbi:MAG: T9SS type A sorting domain-containing protein [Candidatus Hydrothermae bacterium]|nr:T9SS type A sorting domain-containing protein [Candidatus Hydrothermae bacterium]
MRTLGSVTLILISITILWSANWTYEVFSPTGGVIREIAADTASPENPIAITDYDAYIYGNQGWELRDDPEYLSPIAIAPGDGDKFTLISHDGNIYYSADRGDHWVSVASFSHVDALSEVRGETLFVAADSFLYRSTNSGFSWESISSLPYTVTAIDYFGSGGNPLYLGVVVETGERDTTVLLKSTDGGQSWVRIFVEPDSIDIDCITDIESAPDSANRIFLCLGMESGPTMNLLYTPDGGENWYLPAEEVPGLILPSDVEFLSNDTVLVACMYTPAIYRGVWTGTSWEFTNVDSSANFTDIHVCGDIIYAASDQGVYVSADRGNTWERMNAGLHAFPLHEHATITNSVGDNIIYLGEFGSSIYLTHDGMNWEEKFLPGLVFADGGYISPSNPEIVYICGIGVDITDSSWAFHSVYRSEDGGETWVPVDTSYTSPDSLAQFEKILVSASDPYVLLGLYWDPEEDRENLYRSTDGGHSWTPVLEGVDDFLLGTDTVFTLKGGSLWVSLDTGATWASLAEIDWPWDMAYDPHMACVYVAEYFGIERIGLDGQRYTILVAPYGGWEDVSLAVAENSVLYVSYNSFEGPSCLIRLRYGDEFPEVDTLDFRTERGIRVMDGAILLSEMGRGFRKSTDAYLGLKEERERGSGAIFSQPTFHGRRPVLTISCGDPGDYQLEVFDIAGRRVLSKKIRLNEGVNRVELGRDLPSGLYIASLKGKKTKIRGRFIVIGKGRR